MRADPPFADLYLQWRDEDYGRKALPGFVILTEDPKPRVRVYETLEGAFAYIRKLHNQRLTDDAKGKK